ncbi:hypothetical protein R3P38DRAFT_2758942 [Favolaschia claudopus]|uniref:Uncharacterized protein n=1 Tax=Favolaschia claudopus TaxID=2862362 RepID=A0AAW0E6J2_9AGAR
MGEEIYSTPNYLQFRALQLQPYSSRSPVSLNTYFKDAGLNDRRCSLNARPVQRSSKEKGGTRAGPGRTAINHRLPDRSSNFVDPRLFRFGVRRSSSSEILNANYFNRKSESLELAHTRKQVQKRNLKNVSFVLYEMHLTPKFKPLSPVNRANEASSNF